MKLLVIWKFLEKFFPKVVFTKCCNYIYKIEHLCTVRITVAAMLMCPTAKIYIGWKMVQLKSTNKYSDQEFFSKNLYYIHDKDVQHHISRIIVMSYLLCSHDLLLGLQIYISFIIDFVKTFCEIIKLRHIFTNKKWFA